MTQHVRCNVSLYSCILAKLRDDIGNALGGESLADCVQEECRAPRCDVETQLHVSLLYFTGLIVDHVCQAIPSALAFDPEYGLGHCEVDKVQPRSLSDANPRSE